MSNSVTSLNSPPVQPEPLILEGLPNLLDLSDACPRRARIELDLLLLAIEALYLGGSEAILAAADELGLKGIIRNRVALWRLRCANPLRRYAQRRPLTLMEAKALTAIVCHLAKRLTVIIRQLLLAQQQLQEKQLSTEHHFRLSEYLERFRAHFRSRMNPRRTGVLAYNTEEKLNELALRLLGQLLFCTGTSGTQRLWVSLFDGEVE